MMRTQGTGAPGFDPAFYRRRYPDIAGMSDRQALLHYKNHGRSEGRQPNADARFEDSELMASVPPLFVASHYRRLNPDVDQAIADDWDLYLHYIRHGRDEGRSYSIIDPDFYMSVYLDGRAASHEEIGRHFRSNERNPEVHASYAEFLAANEADQPAWQSLFSDRAFSLLNHSWLGETVEGARARVRFIREGIARLAPFSFTKRFDLEFYRELHPLLAAAPPEAAYRHWLFEGLERGEPGSPAEWMAAHGLDFTEYPQAFVWSEYAAANLEESARSNRWTVLKHLLLHDQTDAANWPLVDPGAQSFLLGLAKVRLAQRDYAAAMGPLQRALAGGRASSQLWNTLGDAYHGMELWGAAADCFLKAKEAGEENLWVVVLGAESLAKAGRTDEALSLLLESKAKFGGDQPWLSMFETVTDMGFNSATVKARALYGADRRAEGDEVMERSVAWLSDAFKLGIDFPKVLPVRKKKVIVLANKSLEQCTYYRVDQKAFLFEIGGWEYDIFEWSDVDSFLSALPGSSACIFYRVPAFPSVVRAILHAKSLGVATYYEIDDLIFDPENYPDSFESFQGQIDRSVYQGLIYGTTLYRSAMRLCDYGIASTPTLAARVEMEVERKKCFVVRNGLDPRNIFVDERALPRTDKGKVTIAYGSATLAHNQDFHDMAGDALRYVLDTFPQVELLIIGHLSLDQRFSGYGDRIIKVDLIRDPIAYWSLLSTADINLAVISPSLMTDCKSEIKWLEAAVLGIPSVVSGTATYREVIKDGVTGLIADTPDDWKAALSSLVQDEKRRHRIGQTARELALETYSAAAVAAALDEALAVTQPSGCSPTKKRILLVNVFFPPQSIGGATRVVADNLKHMTQSHEFDFAVAATDHDGRQEYKERVESHNGVPVFRIAPPFEENLDWKYLDDKMEDWFDRVISRYEPDLVHFHCIQRLTSSVIDVCRNRGIPYIVSVHDGWWVSDYQFLFDEEGRMRLPGDHVRLGPKPPLKLADSLQRLSRLRRALGGAERILAPSQNFRDIYLKAGFTNVRAVSNGVSDIFVAPRTQSPTGRVRLAHIGDMSPHKGFDLVEAALRQGEYANVELLALSHAKPPEYRFTTIWGRTSVTIAGRVPQATVPELYANIDVLLAPSACVESYGLVTREANAAGVWVVASDRGAIGEDVRVGVDGFVIDVSSPAALAQVLATIDNDPETYLHSAPKNDALKNSSQQAETLLQIYQEILRDGPSQSKPLSSRRPVRTA
ncbi:glycosyltransferase [Brevundimonas aurantiaca]|uniref:glycosyltransferase n=1 Tax=Brevundimonas aurantiaca TaxID=74316 RepID=UPI00174E5318|nr:glycosyltransferase [Brevundimonas aurantiaca]